MKAKKLLLDMITGIAALTLLSSVVITAVYIVMLISEQYGLEPDQMGLLLFTIAVILVACVGLGRIIRTEWEYMR